MFKFHILKPYARKISYFQWCSILTQDTDLTTGSLDHLWFEMLFGFGRLLKKCTGIVDIFSPKFDMFLENFVERYWFLNILFSVNWGIWTYIEHITDLATISNIIFLAVLLSLYYNKLESISLRLSPYASWKNHI